MSQKRAFLRHPVGHDLEIEQGYVCEVCLGLDMGASLEIQVGIDRFHCVGFSVTPFCLWRSCS